MIRPSIDDIPAERGTLGEFILVCICLPISDVTVTQLGECGVLKKDRCATYSGHLQARIWRDCQTSVLFLFLFLQRQGKVHLLASSSSCLSVSDPTLSRR